MHNRFLRLLISVLAMLTCCQTLYADDHLQFFQRHCIKCHGPGKQEADLRLDTIAPPSANAESSDVWTSIADMIAAGDMRPQQETRPDATQVKRLVSWIGDELFRTSQREPALRRLNRVEYEHTVQDLLGIDAPLAELLPEDAGVQGFDNVAGGLGLSAILMERYLEAADEAFEGVIRRIKPLPPATRRAVLMEIRENVDSVKGKKGGVIQSGVAIAWAETHGPLDQSFPSKAQQKLFGEFLQKLNEIREGEHSLLDQTAILMGSNLGNASSHNNTNLPILAAGGHFQHGQHLAFEPRNPPPLANLLVSLLQHLELDVDEFSSGTSTLTGLERVW